MFTNEKNLVQEGSGSFNRQDKKSSKHHKVVYFLHLLTEHRENSFSKETLSYLHREEGEGKRNPGMTRKVNMINNRKPKSRFWVDGRLDCSGITITEARRESILPFTQTTFRSFVSSSLSFPKFRVTFIN